MRIEDEQFDVLQSIEAQAVRHYRAHPETTDHAVLRVYEALIDAYSAERIGRPPRAWGPTEQEQELLAAVRQVCEWCLGRGPGPHVAPGTPLPPANAIDVETLLLCLKRLRKSVQKWTKELGRQGYLGFVSRFV